MPVARADEMDALAERVEKLMAADRELDLAIYRTLHPMSDLDRITAYRRGLDGKEGYAWDIHGQSVVFEKYTNDGRCPYNGGYPLPAYSASLDAAMSLAPPGSIWDVASTGIAWVDTPGDPALHTAKGSTPALALAAACLRAHASIIREAGR